MYRALIVGAGKGLGYELAKRYVEREASTTVYATYRTEANAAKLRDLKAAHGDRIHLFQLDVTDDAQAKSVAEQVKQLTSTLDLVLVSAATFGDIKCGPTGLPPSGLLDAFNINTVGAHRIALQFSPLLVERAKEGGRMPSLVFMTAQNGSCREVDRINQILKQMLKIDVDSPAPAYAISKQALSMLALQWAGYLNSKGVLSYTIQPGAIYRGEGKPPADWQVRLDDSMSGLIATIDKMDVKRSREGIHGYDDAVYGF